MSDRLRNLLDDTAQDARVSRLAADALWTRGRRRRRLGQAAGSGVALLVVLVLVALSTGTWQLPQAAQPARGPGSEPALPDRVYAPPPDVEVLREGDAFEPVAILFNGSVRREGFLGSTSAFAVVGAETGTYRFLDLPGLFRGAQSRRAALADDGSLLVWTYEQALWTWTAATGDVTSFPLDGGGNPLLSHDAATVAMERSSPTGRGFGRVDVVQVDVTTGAVRPLEGCGTPVGWTADDAVLCLGSGLDRVDPDTGASTELSPFGSSVPTRVGPSPDGSTATSADRQGTRLRVVDLAGGGPLRRLDTPPLGYADDPLGWASAREVVVNEGGRLQAVDVDSGATRTLVDFDSREIGTYVGLLVAADLVAVTPYAAEEPTWPAPRWLWLLLGGLVALGGGGAWLRRRSR